MCTPNPNEVGWIRLYRKMTEWRWYGVPNMMAVFIHLLLTANHRDGFSFGVEIKRGQVLTSEDGIMRSIRIKRGALRVCLKKLEETGEIIRNATNQYSIITVCNYDSYQSNAEPYNQPCAIGQPAEYIQIEPTPDKPLTAIDKSAKDEKKKDDEMIVQRAREEFETFRKVYPGKKRGLDTEFSNYRKKHKDWREALPLLLPAAQAYANQTRSTPQKYIKHLQTWINNREWETNYDATITPATDEINRTYQRNGISPAGYGCQDQYGNEFH